MQFSRSHAGMLAVVSIFTGVIAPIGSYLGQGTPLPLTDRQWIAYVMLLILIIIFYLVSIGSWKRMRFFSYLLVAIVLSVFYFSITDSLINIRTGYILTSMSWAWIFLVAGCILLIGTTHFEYEEYTPISHMSDKIVGLIGSITLTVLSIIILTISFVFPVGHAGKSILRGVFGSGEVISQSGVMMSPIFESITDLTFDRKSDSLIFAGIEKTNHEKINKSFALGNKKIEIEGNIVSIDGKTQSGTLVQLFEDDYSFVIHDSLGLSFITPFDEKKFAGAIENAPQYITKDTSSKTLAWGIKSASGYNVIKNGDRVGKTLASIDQITLSPSGYDIMVLGTSQSGSNLIIKNGTDIENVRENMINKAYQSNGSHFLYVIGKSGEYHLVYDGSIVPGDFEEVRETFLEKSGNSYGYFARPLGEKKYCLFTRYRGNICGLDGYMNPRLSADGGSILFAGLKDNVWSIYRNTGIVIQDTKYTKKDITNDYVFFDITNPRQYLFIEKNEDGSYGLRKNGKQVVGTWEDVGLDVTFGYDNKMIMTAKDESGWRIIEF